MGAKGCRCCGGYDQAEDVISWTSPLPPYVHQSVNIALTHNK